MLRLFVLHSRRLRSLDSAILMQRRQLLLAGAAGSLKTTTASGRIRVALFGGEHSHAFEKARILKASPDWDLAGIVEESPQVAEQYERLGVPRLSRDAALGDKSIPVIAVESAVRNHVEHAVLALRAGKHVHLEKPIAHTREGMNSVVREARSRKLLVQAGYMWRYNPGFQKVFEAAKAGWLGDVYMVRGMINTLIAPERRPEWALFKGGQMFELGGHLIDQVVRILGSPVRVQATLRKHSDHHDTLVDNTVAVFEYPKALAVVQSSTLQPGAGSHRSFEVLGSNGTAVIRPLEQPVLDIDLAKGSGPYKAGKQRIELPKYQRYVDDFVDLAAAVRDARPLAVSLEHELAVNDALLRASDMG